MMGNAERLDPACRQRIAAREPGVGAWTFLDRELVLTQARAVDSGSAQRPLHGLAVGIKDIIATADMPTEYGSPIYSGHRPAWDAACVAAIRNAGGVVMGKTVTTEFATSHPGRTRNPHDAAHTPGGSSSGSAAAVADGMIPLALGTQTGGSVIRPASFCGVVGYKLGFGLVSRHGVKPVSESLDTVGVFARSVREAGLLAGVIARRPELCAVRAIEPPRIGLWPTCEWREASRETVSALDDAARLLAAAGAQVRAAEMPQPFSAINDAHHVIEYFEMAQAFAFEMRAHREHLSQRLRERLDKAAQVTAAQYDEAWITARACRRVMDEVFTQFDVLLAPSATGEAPRGLESTGNAVFNRGWTLLGLPCMTLPGFRGPNGLPVGVQLVARQDARLLAIAAWVERMLPK
jgi:Asp-tRNA(Asn)/Glu-tRNA(Gln) amidotransferase A subunit family amidase